MQYAPVKYSSVLYLVCYWLDSSTTDRSSLIGMVREGFFCIVIGLGFGHTRSLVFPSTPIIKNSLQIIKI